eukprot:scaffold2577_cov127-Skeletonema_menzelii.AAC.6
MGVPAMHPFLHCMHHHDSFVDPCQLYPVSQYKRSRTGLEEPFVGFGVYVGRVDIMVGVEGIIEGSCVGLAEIIDGEEVGARDTVGTILICLVEKIQ